MNAYDIVTRALRRIGVLAAGEVPENTMIDDAVDTLKSILSRAVSEGAFGRLTDVVAPAGDFIASENTRVVRSDIDTTSIELPDSVTDPVTHKSRPPLDKSVIQINDEFTGSTITYIYDGTVRQWLPIETIDQTSVVPLAARDGIGISAYLATELADEYGQSPSQTTVMAAMRFQHSLVNDYSQAERIIPRPTNYF